MLQQGSFRVVDGQVMHDEQPVTVADGTADPELVALIELRDAALTLLELEADPSLPDSALVDARATAAARYEQYVGRFGAVNRAEVGEGPADPQTGLPTMTFSRPSLGGFRADPDYLTVLALEVYDASTGVAGPAPILLRRVNGHPHPTERVANADEALAVVSAEGGGGSAGSVLDLDRVAGLLGLPDAGSALHALGELVYADPGRDGAWVPAREYLSGDVRAALTVAQAAAADDDRYLRNVRALERLVPPDVGPQDIAVSLGAPWVSPQDIEAFVHEVIGGRVTVWHLPSAASWKLVRMSKLPAAAVREWGTPRLNGYDLVAMGLNGRTPVVFDVVQEPGRRRRYRNPEQSLAAYEKLQALNERFATWVWEDASRAGRLCAEYNRRFNAHVVTPFDGTRLSFPGLADGVELWPWQRDIVARIISSPATLCGHAVGAGKTRSMVCAAMTARRLGLARTPLIAVPAHLVEQVAREARQTYPFGRFLVAGESAVAGRARDTLATRCASGDWDAVVMSHGMFTSLPVSADVEIAWLQEQRESVEAQLRGGRGGAFGRTELTRRRTSLDARIERACDPSRRRPPVTFEQLGVDLLLIDEAHYFKRLPVSSRREGMNFGSSQRAADLMLKVRTLRSRRGTLPSLALFTGTPWTNSIAETFVWQSFLQPDVLAEAGVEHFDAWAAMFVDYRTTVEVTPDSSGFRTATRPATIRNVPELRAMLRRCAEVLPADVLGLERPGVSAETIVCTPGPGQAQYVRTLGARADKIRREPLRARPGDDNMLALCGDGRRVALDPPLVGVREDSPKIAALADRVASLHRTGAQVRYPGSDVPGVFQVIFCDQGTPGADGLQTYGRIRLALVARGVPAERVRFVHEATTGAARTALFTACRDGRVSVLIGSTDKLGVGTNIQTRLRAVHHADAPWRPSDVEQREGRALRPGNLNPLVAVLRYVTEQTFDGYMWQTLERKARFIDQLLRGGTDVREISDVGDVVLTFAEVKALATGDPLLLEQAHAAAEVRRLRVMRSVDAQALTELRRQVTEQDEAMAACMRHETMLSAARDRLTWFDERAPAGRDPGTAEHPDAAVAGAVARARELLLAPDSQALSTPVRAPWRGLGIELVPDGGWAHPAALLVRTTLAHRRVDELVLPVPRHRRLPVTYAARVTQALTRWVRELDQRIDQVAADAVEAHDAAERARAAMIDHRFAHAEALARAEALLAEIDTALEASLEPAARNY